MTITPFSKSRFWEGRNFLVQRAAQKWSSLQKMIVSMRWSFWQEMSNFYFSIENYPKGGPLDDFFPHFLLLKTMYFVCEWIMSHKNLKLWVLHIFHSCVLSINVQSLCLNFIRKKRVILSSSQPSAQICACYILIIQIL